MSTLAKLEFVSEHFLVRSVHGKDRGPSYFAHGSPSKGKLNATWVLDGLGGSERESAAIRTPTGQLAADNRPRPPAGKDGRNAQR